MASQVLSGTSNVSYTNNTGQNVRIVINYMAQSTSSNISINWGTANAQATLQAIGRNLAYVDATSGATTTNNNNAFGYTGSGGALPTEIILAPSQVFSASCGAYNVVVIPEAG